MEEERSDDKYCESESEDEDVLGKFTRGDSGYHSGKKKRNNRNGKKSKLPEYGYTPLRQVDDSTPNGLINQASTCYLNSLVQALYMTPEFRNGIYRLDCTNMSEDCLAVQLQCLFAQLQLGAQPGSTTGLTRCLQTKVYEQRDVQEFWHEMFDILEKELAGTNEANLIKDLYLGKMKDYVTCVKCGFEDARTSKFLDIPLVVKPFGQTSAYESVEESLTAFVESQRLTGDNQSFCTKCKSKQEADKGLKFTEYPYILSMLLMRFEIDYNTMLRVKLNDRVEFPLDLKVQPSISHEKKQASPRQAMHGSYEHTYKLFAVLVHTGSTVVGHYYAYIRSLPENRWFYFNDQHVEEVQEGAIEKTFGDDPGQRSYTRGGLGNAYMLMYRKVDKRNEGFHTPPVREEASEKRIRKGTEHQTDEKKHREEYMERSKQWKESRGKEDKLQREEKEEKHKQETRKQEEQKRGEKVKEAQKDDQWDESRRGETKQWSEKVEEIQRQEARRPKEKKQGENEEEAKWQEEERQGEKKEEKVRQEARREEEHRQREKKEENQKQEARREQAKIQRERDEEKQMQEARREQAKIQREREEENQRQEARRDQEKIQREREENQKQEARREQEKIQREREEKQRQEARREQEKIQREREEEKQRQEEKRQREMEEVKQRQEKKRQREIEEVKQRQEEKRQREREEFKQRQEAQKQEGNRQNEKEAKFLEETGREHKRRHREWEEKQREEEKRQRQREEKRKSDRRRQEEKRQREKKEQQMRQEEKRQRDREEKWWQEEQIRQEEDRLRGREEKLWEEEKVRQDKKRQRERKEKLRKEARRQEESLVQPLHRENKANRWNEAMMITDLNEEEHTEIWANIGQYKYQIQPYQPYQPRITAETRQTCVTKYHSVDSGTTNPRDNDYHYMTNIHQKQQYHTRVKETRRTGHMHEPVPYVSTEKETITAKEIICDNLIAKENQIGVRKHLRSSHLTTLTQIMDKYDRMEECPQEIEYFTVTEYAARNHHRGQIYVSQKQHWNERETTRSQSYTQVDTRQSQFHSQAEANIYGIKRERKRQKKMHKQWNRSTQFSPFR